jgi:hypothetical protein
MPGVFAEFRKKCHDVFVREELKSPLYGELPGFSNANELQ